MAGRLKICVLIATCSFASHSALAQGPRYFGDPGLQPGGVAFSSYEQNAPGGAPPQVAGPNGPSYGRGQFAPVNAPSGVGYIDYDGTVVTRSELEEDDGELCETPFEKAILRAVRSSWVRFDYMQWSLEDVGGQTTDYDLTEVGLHNIDGVQTTIGLPFTFGSFEISGFLLEQASDEVFVSNIAGSGGVFESRFTSDVWGADINFIMDPYVPGEGFKLRPMGGVRYFAIQEELKLPANPSPASPEFARSVTFNNVVAPQLGIRAELVHRWFTIGAEPKVGFGVNTYLAEISNNDFLGGGIVREREYETTFAPYGDLDVYAHIPCGEHFSLYVAYNLLFMAGVSRPQDNLAHNVTDGFHLEDERRGFRMEGYTLGGQFTF